MSPCLHVFATTSQPLPSALPFKAPLFLLLLPLLLLHFTPEVIATFAPTTAPDINNETYGNDGESLSTVEIVQGDSPNSSVCRRALKLAGSRDLQCKVAKHYRGCQFDSGFIPYLKFQYCNFQSPIAPTILMVLWLLTLLGAFAVIADSFFSPALIALARSMRMSQNLAGVTLLAFGNGAPDVFSAITAITTGDPEAPDEGLGLGFLMGSGLLVNTITAGLIMIIRSFRTTRRPFIKDTLFYMSAITWSAVILVRRMIYLSDSVGFICLYLFYVLVTWASGRLYRKKNKSKVYRTLSDFVHRLALRGRIVFSSLCPSKKGLDDSQRLKNELVVAEKLPNLERGIGLQRLQRFFNPSSHTSDVLRKVSALRIRQNFKSPHMIPDEIMTTDMPISNGYCTKGGHMAEPNDVTLVGFRPKSKVHDFRRRLADGMRTHWPPLDGSEKVASCPRIEVSAPDDESQQATLSPQVPSCLNSAGLLYRTSSSLPTNEQSLANRENSLRLSNSHGRSSITPSTNSRRGSQITSITQGSEAMETYGGSSRLPSSSMRRRSLVGPIGLRTRTPSMNQRRSSQRGGTIEQLPFVVRWIIANKEAEEKELGESTESIYEREAVMEEKMRDAAVQSGFEHPPRQRYGSDSIQAHDITSILNTPSDMAYGRHLTALSHSPSASFLGKSPAFQASRIPNNLRGLHRISSNSLPDLDQLATARAFTPQSILTPRPGLYKQEIGGHPTDLRVQFEESPLASVLGKPSKLQEDIAEEGTEKYEENEEREVEEEEVTIEDEEEDDDAFMRWGSKGMWHHLVYSICPIDLDEWKRISIPMKILQILQAPIFLLFRLTIPVVIEDLEPAPPASTEATETSLVPIPGHDVEVATIQGAAKNSAGEAIIGSKVSMTTIVTESQNSFQSSKTDFPPVATTAAEGSGPSRQPAISGSSDDLVDFEQLHGWCRLLNTFQCLLTPMLWVMLITIGGQSVGQHKIGETGIPVVVIVLLISACLAITIFVTSKWDRPPTPYHRPFFATLGFITSVIWIYAIAHELVNSLETLGIVWEISEAILGISVMAFASSIGDIMSNSLLAHNGYPRIAYAACSGSPLFNLLIGAGASYTIKIARTGDYNAPLSFTLTHALLFTFLLVVLTTNLIVAFACNFEMRKAYGIVLILAYTVFLTLAILIEADVIVSPRQWHLLTGTE